MDTEINEDARALRIAYRTSFESYRKQMNELNRRFYELSLKVDELLDFIEKFTKNEK